LRSASTSAQASASAMAKKISASASPVAKKIGELPRKLSFKRNKSLKKVQAGVAKEVEAESDESAMSAAMNWPEVREARINAALKVQAIARGQSARSAIPDPKLAAAERRANNMREAKRKRRRNVLKALLLFGLMCLSGSVALIGVPETIDMLVEQTKGAAETMAASYATASAAIRERAAALADAGLSAQMSAKSWVNSKQLTVDAYRTRTTGESLAAAHVQAVASSEYLLLRDPNIDAAAAAITDFVRVEAAAWRRRSDTSSDADSVRIQELLLYLSALESSAGRIKDEL
jgi:hypothetical protein